MASKNEQKIQEIVNAMAVPGIIGTGAGNKITGNQIASTIRSIPKKTQLTQTVSSSELTITATPGYYPNEVRKVISVFNGGTLYLPTTSNQTIYVKNRYLNSNLTVQGDANLIPENIKNTVSIFGVNGTFGGNGVRTVHGTFRSSSRNFVFTATNYDQQMNQTNFINVSNQALSYSGLILDSIVVFINIVGTSPPYYNNGLILLNTSAQTTPRVFYFRVVSSFTIEI